jgi:hypothetical protein
LFAPIDLFQRLSAIYRALLFYDFFHNPVYKLMVGFIQNCFNNRSSNKSLIVIDLFLDDSFTATCIRSIRFGPHRLGSATSA